MGESPNFRADICFQPKTKYIMSLNDDNKYACEQCEYITKRKDSLITHVQGVHKGIKFPCPNLHSILFMYFGEATLFHERMNLFLNVAKDLGIKEIEENFITDDDDDTKDINSFQNENTTYD